MYDYGIFPDKGYKKSARVVGEVLGKYHPHGDTSVYDAMVRLAQPYNMRMTLVNGQGNFGSVDGDPAAAMRYTEVKMQPLAMELVKDIEKDTVKWNLNFDDSLKEPDVLPSHYPNLLVNGATGIAVGLATNIPPHNLGEVIDGACAYIDNPKITLPEMMKIVQGPDFPTGGYVISGDELKKAYTTGKGKIMMRAKLHIEENDKGGKNIVITEIPYTVNKAEMLRKIDDMCSDGDDKKKKQILADNIMSVADESDRNGMRAVIRLKKDANVEKTLEALYKYSDLQLSFGINMVVIADGKPQQLGLLDIFRYYTEFQRNVVLRRTKYDLDKAKERAHILEGLIIAVENIDEVIRIIKTSQDTATARANLRKTFNLSEKQANAILDLRLARLTKLEVTNLKQELKRLKELIKEYEAIIASKKKQFEVVTKELLEVKRKYADERRTTIVETADKIEVKVGEDKHVVETYVIALNELGKLRKLKPSQFKRLSENTRALPRDIFTQSVKATTEEQVYCFTNLGNCFKIDVEVMPEAKGSLSGGVTLEDMFRQAQSNEKAVGLFAVKGIEVPEGRLLFVTKQGMIKVTPWQEYTVLKGYYQAMKIKDDDEIITVEQENPQATLLYVTKKGMTLNMLYDGVPEQLRVAGGVKGMGLYEGDEVIYAIQIVDKQKVVLGASNGLFKVVECDTIKKLVKTRKGVMIMDLGDKKFAEIVLKAKVVSEDTKGVYILDRLGQEFYADLKDIAQDTRESKGKLIKSIGNCQPDKVMFF